MINRWIHSTQRHLQSIFKNAASKESELWRGPHFRLCHLQKRPGQTYGFTVQKSEDVLSTGHVVNAVNPESPAYLSNLRAGDRIVEVNGCNVENENYEQLANRIKAGLRLAEPHDECDECFHSGKDMLESLSSNDSGLASETTPRKERNYCSNQCLLLVLDPQCYSQYRLNRSAFVAAAAVIYKQPAKIELDYRPEDTSCNKTSSHMIVGLADNGIHSNVSDRELLSSSNESFDDLESHVDSSLTANDATNSSRSDGSFPLSSCDKTMKALPQENRFAPRLCYLKKVDGFQGYGFNLVCPRNSNVQVIGKVEPGSPANIAGLLNDDIVIEVNGVNILNENHRQVVSRITEGLIRNGRRHRDEVVLLVVDPEAKRWYDEKGININYNLPNILAMGGFKSGDVQLGKGDDPACLADSTASTDISSKPIRADKTDQPARKLCKASIEVTINSPARVDAAASAPCTPAARSGKVPTCKQNGSRQFGVYLDMTAAEMREILRKRGGKRNMVDRYNNLTMLEKYHIIQNM